MKQIFRISYDLLWLISSTQERITTYRGLESYYVTIYDSDWKRKFSTGEFCPKSDRDPFFMLLKSCRNSSESESITLRLSTIIFVILFQLELNFHSLAKCQKYFDCFEYYSWFVFICYVMRSGVIPIKNDFNS